MRKQDQHIKDLMDAIEAAPLTWAKAYFVDNINPLTGTVYRGFNRIILTNAAFMNGYGSNLWATYNQLKKAGIRIKYEETKNPHYISFFSVIEDEDEKTGKKIRKGAFLKWFRVFNADQLENPEELKSLAGQQIDAEIPENYKNIIDAIGEKIGVTFKFGKASFIPNFNVVRLPSIENYTPEAGGNAAKYWFKSALHELGHAYLNLTGDTKKFTYAEEEVIVESAAFLTAKHFGLKVEELDISNSGAYIKGWMAEGNVTANKASRLFAWGDKVADYLIGCYESGRLLNNLEKVKNG